MIPILVSSTFSHVIDKEVYSGFCTKVVADHYFIFLYNWVLIRKGMISTLICRKTLSKSSLFINFLKTQKVCMWENSHGVVWFHDTHISVKYLSSLISGLQNGK